MVNVGYFVDRCYVVCLIFSRLILSCVCFRFIVLWFLGKFRYSIIGVFNVLSCVIQVEICGEDKVVLFRNVIIGVCVVVIGLFFCSGMCLIFMFSVLLFLLSFWICIKICIVRGFVKIWFVICLVSVLSRFRCFVVNLCLIV